MKLATRFHEPPMGKTHAGRGFQKPIQELNHIALKLGLPDSAARRAESITNDASQMGFIRDVSPNVVVAAGLYIASREFKEPATLRDIAAAYGCDPREVGRCYVTILDRMHISRPHLNGNRYVRRLVLKRPLSPDAYKCSEEIIGRVTQAGLGGRNPMTLAAAALYLACCSTGENVTQAEVAEAAGVGEESVRECCKAIRTLERHPAA